jgi:hypothetical protein
LGQEGSSQEWSTGLICNVVKNSRIILDIHRIPAGERQNPYPTRFNHGSDTVETHGSNFMPEPESDGSDIHRISEPTGKIAIPTPTFVEFMHIIPHDLLNYDLL